MYVWASRGKHDVHLCGFTCVCVYVCVLMEEAACSSVRWEMGLGSQALV